MTKQIGSSVDFVLKILLASKRVSFVFMCPIERIYFDSNAHISIHTCMYMGVSRYKGLPMVSDNGIGSWNCDVHEGHRKGLKLASRRFTSCSYCS